MKNLGLLLAFASFSLGACATERYGFRPAAPATTSEAGFPASRYAVPPEAPRGEVYVTSFGTREVESGVGGRTELVHVRLAVANQTGDRAWGVDPSAQLLMMPGAPPEKPEYMEIDGRRDSNPTVERGQRKVIDLYYRMPAGASDAGHLPAFDYQWQVDTGDKVVAERTPFVREPLRDYGESDQRTVAVGMVAPWWAYGYGPLWWGGLGWYGGWGYPYGPYYGYGYGPYVGIGVGFRGGYRPYSYGGSRYGGGGYYGGGRGGGGGGRIMAPSVRGRPGR